MSDGLGGCLIQTLGGWVIQMSDGSGMFDSCVRWLRGVFDSYVRWLRGMFDSDVRWLRRMFDSYIRWFRGMFDSDVRWLRRMFDSYVRWLRGMFDSYIRWLRGMFDSYVRWLRRVGDAEVGCLRRVGDADVSWLSLCTIECFSPSSLQIGPPTSWLVSSFPLSRPCGPPSSPPLPRFSTRLSISMFVLSLLSNSFSSNPFFSQRIFLDSLIFVPTRAETVYLLWVSPYSPAVCWVPAGSCGKLKPKGGWHYCACR